MPIKAENRKLYPPDWAQIVARIRARAGDRCEACGVRNHAIGGRLPDGTFLEALPKGERRLRLEWPKPGEHWHCAGGGRTEFLRVIRIVCTTAHLDHNPANCAPENLRYLCQRCHLRYDAGIHAQHARETRRKRLAMRDLFEPGAQ